MYLSSIGDLGSVISCMDNERTEQGLFLDVRISIYLNLYENNMYFCCFKCFRLNNCTFCITSTSTFTRVCKTL